MKTLALVLVSLVLAAAAPSPDSEPPAEGKLAPKFALPSQEGKTVKLGDYYGKWVVLYFYPKDFTKGCTLEAHDFQKSLKALEKEKAVVLGVSAQDAGSHKDFCAKEGLSFKLLSDPGLKVSALYGSVMRRPEGDLSARNTFLIAPNGMLARRFLKVDPAGHAAQVLSAIKELKAK
jgi:peroxiredoxin Q/BCP